MEKSLDSEYCRPAHFGRPLTRSRQKGGKSCHSLVVFLFCFVVLSAGTNGHPMPRERRADNNSVPNEYIMQPRLNTFQDKKKTKTSRSRDFLIAIHRPTVTGVLHLVVQQQLENPKKGKNFLKKEIKDTRGVYTLGVSSHTNISALVI